MVIPPYKAPARAAYDIVIVGGAAIGSSVAYWLSQALGSGVSILVVERASLPDVLEVTAWTADGLIMGLRHRTLPVFGVQFHPESIASQGGHALLANFLAIARGSNVQHCAA